MSNSSGGAKASEIHRSSFDPEKILEAKQLDDHREYIIDRLKECPLFASRIAEIQDRNPQGLIRLLLEQPLFRSISICWDDDKIADFRLDL